MIFIPLGVLGPEIKLVLTIFAIIGPIAIGMLFLIIKRIERRTPDKIRWR